MLADWMIALVLSVSCVTIILLFTLLGQYSHPSSDDFCMAAGVNKLGVADQLWLHYFEWSGRYTGNVLYAVYPILFGLFEGYRFIAVSVILALLLAAAFFLSRCFAISLFARPVLLVSLCFVCVYLLGMTSPASGLYWMAGAYTYQTANVLFLLIAGLMIRLNAVQQQAHNTGRLLAALLLLMFVAIGTNETSMLVFVALALTGVIIRLRAGRRKLQPWLAILVVSLLCFAIVYLSPGNAIRAADFPLRHDFSRSILGSLSVGLKLLWSWLSNPVLAVSSMLLPFAIASMQQISDRRFCVSRKTIILLLLNTLIVPVLLQFPAWWSMGGWPPARTVDVIYFLFLISWYISISAISLYYLERGRWSAIKLSGSTVRQVTAMLLSILLSFTMLQSNAVQQVETDLFHLARPYHEYLLERYRLIEQAKADGRLKLIVPAYQQELPDSLFFNDIMQNAKHWRNVCYADYFGLEKIKRAR